MTACYNSPMQEIAEALRESAAQAGWNATRLAAEVEKSEQSARQWMRGEAMLSGPDLLKLLRTMPGLAERLLPTKPEAVRGAA